MAIFRNRLPSAYDIVLVFAACVVPVHTWSILIFFEKMSRRWVLFLNSWDLLGILAYAQVFAFLVSTIVLLILILLSMVLPARLFRSRFAAQGCVMALLTSVCAIVLQYDPRPFFSAKGLLVGLLLYCAGSVVVFGLIHRYQRLEGFLRGLAERLTALLYIYATVSFLSVIVVALRSI